MDTVQLDPALALDARPADAVVIGAGQAGLSSAYFLRRFGLDTVVLDAEDGPGGAWRHRSPSLTMDKIHGIFDLPGVRREAEPAFTARARDVVPAYYAEYEREAGLDVVRPVKVGAVSEGPDDRLLVSAGERRWAARAVVNASGTWARPHWPYYPGAAAFLGRQTHYAAYRGPEPYAGLRVAVVGGGASAAHVLSELAGVAAATLWMTRRPVEWRDDDFGEEARRDAVALVERRVRAGLPPRSVVSVTGLSRTGVVRTALAKGALDRQEMFTRLTPDGASWADGRHERLDAIVWATGFRSALGHLAPLRLREPGGGIRVDGTRVLREPRLHLVGYGPSASTVGANRAGRAAALAVRELLTG
ncbi:FAD-dependent oxidoreductase [Nonomuraea longicatena]|uniref:NAD(P)-binding domain-containing protein n=1 Tax=Nonomuraea longicatena TaxID=83682 RepID=A0ABN1R452_9ACTN